MCIKESLFRIRLLLVYRAGVGPQPDHETCHQSQAAFSGGSGGGAPPHTSPSMTCRRALPLLLQLLPAPLLSEGAFAMLVFLELGTVAVPRWLRHVALYHG